MSLSKTINFYGRFLIPFSRVGFALKGLSAPDRYDGLAGKTILVTGATGGIGAGIALAAARSGATVLAVGRSEDRLAELQARAAGSQGAITPVRADLSLAGETLSLIADMKTRGVRIDALVNNVGALNHAYVETEEGIDGMYAINILNPFILTEGLIEAGVLARGAPGDAVVVNMASGGMYNAPQNLVFMEQGREGYNGFAAYATHKRAQLVLSDAWSRPGSAIRAYTMHPGWVDTEGVRRSLPKFRKILKPVLRDEAQGADTALWLIGQRPDPEPGALWFDRKPRSPHAFKRTRTPLASDEAIRAKLDEDASALKARLATGDAA